jgi:hypothetical protein
MPFTESPFNLPSGSGDSQPEPEPNIEIAQMLNRTRVIDAVQNILICLILAAMIVAIVWIFKR